MEIENHAKRVYWDESQLMGQLHSSLYHNILILMDRTFKKNGKYLVGGAHGGAPIWKIRDGWVVNV